MLAVVCRAESLGRFDSRRVHNEALEEFELVCNHAVLALGALPVLDEILRRAHVFPDNLLLPSPRAPGRHGRDATQSVALSASEGMHGCISHARVSVRASFVALELKRAAGAAALATIGPRGNDDW